MIRCIRIWTNAQDNSCFEAGALAGRLTDSNWLPRLKQIVLTYGIDLKTDAAACRRTRPGTAPALGLGAA